MGMHSDWNKYPFGILQKTAHQITISETHKNNGICKNPDCRNTFGDTTNYWCSDKCYEKVKFERQVAGTWKD